MKIEERNHLRHLQQQGGGAALEEAGIFKKKDDDKKAGGKGADVFPGGGKGEGKGADGKGRGGGKEADKKGSKKDEEDWAKEAEEERLKAEREAEKEREKAEKEEKMVGGKDKDKGKDTDKGKDKGKWKGEGDYERDDTEAENHMPAHEAATTSTSTTMTTKTTSSISSPEIASDEGATTTTTSSSSASTANPSDSESQVSGPDTDSDSDAEGSDAQEQQQEQENDSNSNAESPNGQEQKQEQEGSQQETEEEWPETASGEGETSTTTTTTASMANPNDSEPQVLGPNNDNKDAESPNAQGEQQQQQEEEGTQQETEGEEEWNDIANEEAAASTASFDEADKVDDVEEVAGTPGAGDHSVLRVYSFQLLDFRLTVYFRAPEGRRRNLRGGKSRATIVASSNLDVSAAKKLGMVVGSYLTHHFEVELKQREAEGLKYVPFDSVRVAPLRIDRSGQPTGASSAAFASPRSYGVEASVGQENGEKQPTTVSSAYGGSAIFFVNESGSGDGGVVEELIPAEHTARSMQIAALSNSHGMLRWIQQEGGAAMESPFPEDWISPAGDGEEKSKKNNELGWDNAVNVEVAVLREGEKIDDEGEVEIDASTDGSVTTSNQQSKSINAVSIAISVLALVVFLAAMVVGYRLFKTVRESTREDRISIAKEDKKTSKTDGKKGVKSKEKRKDDKACKERKKRRRKRGGRVAEDGASSTDDAFAPASVMGSMESILAGEADLQEKGGSYDQVKGGDTSSESPDDADLPHHRNHQDDFLDNDVNNDDVDMDYVYDNDSHPHRRFEDFHIKHRSD